MKKLWMLVLLAGIAACDSRSGMEIRTYTLGRLTVDQAESLLTPYIREGGLLSGRDRLLTVREKPDRLKLVEDLLKKYDGGGEALDVVLNIQVIEADGFTERDSAIADVEQTLRGMFKYHGYKLLGETRIVAREGSHFDQSASAFQISGDVMRVTDQGGEKRVPVEIGLGLRPAGPQQVSIHSTITTTIGKPTVLGQSTNKGALILVVRPSIAGS